MIDADRAAEHDQQIRLQRIDRREDFAVEIAIANGIAGLRLHGVEYAEVFKMDVPDSHGRFLRSRFFQSARRSEVDHRLATTNRMARRAHPFVSTELDQLPRSPVSDQPIASSRPEAHWPAS
jgi:hypothetical protein